jgi:Uma2 family endonuclease
VVTKATTTIDKREEKAGELFATGLRRCLRLQNEVRVRGKEEIDLAVDPPPDLVIEIDITRPSLEQKKIKRRTKKRTAQ